MVILVAHNLYQQPGGEDIVAAQEINLLRSAGHEVVEYYRFNSDINSIGIANKAKIATRTLWASQSTKDFRQLIAQKKPDIAHFHNTFPLISPSAYFSCQQAGIPVIQTLHNYRLLCPAAIFYRDGHVCEDCLGKLLPWPSVVHSCYRASRAQTAVATTMLTVHHWLKTWQKQVDVYISLSEFARTKFIKGGLPAEKLVVRQNFVYPDPGLGDGQENYAVYVGRLSPEKGIETLLDAWERLNSRIPLKIAGDGPLGPTVAEAAQRSDNIQWLGRLEKPQVMALMKDATLLVLPSLLYENFPMVIAEAYAVGLPIVASNLGSMSSLVHHGVTGAHFRPGDSKDLAAQIEWILADSQRLALMRHKARAEFEAKYTAEQNYKTLMSIYQRAIQTSDLRNA